MGSMLNNRLYVLFFISLAFGWSRSRVLEKRTFAVEGELPVESFRAHSFESDALSNSGLSAVSSEESEKSKPLPRLKLQKSTLKERKVFPPYVEEFIHPKVKNADAWTVLQTVGLIFPDSRQALSLWRTDLAGYVSYGDDIQRFHDVGASLAKEVISISSKRQHMVETLSGFFRSDGALAVTAIQWIEGVSREDVKFSLQDALGEQAWERVSNAFKDNAVHAAWNEDEISDEVFQKLTNLVNDVQTAKKDIKTHIDVWKELIEKNPKTVGSNEALQKIKTRVDGLIENYKLDLISKVKKSRASPHKES